MSGIILLTLFPIRHHSSYLPKQSLSVQNYHPSNPMKIGEKVFDISKTPLGDLVIGLAFGKFSKLLPVKRIKETEKVIAFWHPKPFWEKHIVLVPKKTIKTLSDLSFENSVYISEVFLMAKEIILDLHWSGYSIVVNGGSRQEVGQIHFHLHSGKQIQ